MGCGLSKGTSRTQSDAETHVITAAKIEKTTKISNSKSKKPSKRKLSDGKKVEDEKRGLTDNTDEKKLSNKKKEIPSKGKKNSKDKKVKGLDSSSIDTKKVVQIFSKHNNEDERPISQQKNVSHKSWWEIDDEINTETNEDVIAIDTKDNEDCIFKTENTTAISKGSSPSKDAIPSRIRDRQISEKCKHSREIPQINRGNIQSNISAEADKESFLSMESVEISDDDLKLGSLDINKEQETIDEISESDSSSSIDTENIDREYMGKFNGYVPKKDIKINITGKGYNSVGGYVGAINDNTPPKFEHSDKLTSFKVSKKFIEKDENVTSSVFDTNNKNFPGSQSNTNLEDQNQVQENDSASSNSFRYNIPKKGSAITSSAIPRPKFKRPLPLKRGSRIPLSTRAEPAIPTVTTITGIMNKLISLPDTAWNQHVKTHTELMNMSRKYPNLLIQCDLQILMSTAKSLIEQANSGRSNLSNSALACLGELFKTCGHLLTPIINDAFSVCIRKSLPISPDFIRNTANIALYRICNTSSEPKIFQSLLLQLRGNKSYQATVLSCMILTSNRMGCEISKLKILPDIIELACKSLTVGSIEIRKNAKILVGIVEENTSCIQKIVSKLKDGSRLSVSASQALKKYDTVEKDEYIRKLTPPC